MNETQLQPLSQGEIAVVVRLDLRDKQIAEELGVEVTTVSKRCSSIFTKFGVATRTAAALEAVRHGYIPVPGFQRSRVKTSKPSSLVEALTEPEIEVLKHLSLSRGEISQRLGIGVGTVVNIVSNIYRKLGKRCSNHAL